MATRSPAPANLDDDDLPIGRVLSRREVLTLLGSGAGAALLAACVPQALSTASGLATGSAAASAGASATASASAAASGGTAVPSCVMVPELTEGPYYVDGVMERADIRTDPNGGKTRDGVPLELTFAVARVNDSDCSPFEGAVVDIWHCDALGEYSGVSGAGQSDQTGSRWLRGYQVTDANGLAAFTTVYPGWYSGRAVHVHFKVRTNPASNAGAELTSQLFFDDELSRELFTTREPYAQKGEQDVTNDRDGIFAASNGQLGLTPVAHGDGYAATFALGVQLP
ncbi:MAG TPA: intradiol ring-cleavage dioxygenase [Candidatus Limnocylindria bacterium]|jgi:protocatechuate 3,4-dioxygenase beta subunit